MVYEYGMGTSIRSHQVPADDFTVSEALRQTRDEEVQAIAEEAYRGAHRLLTDHRDLLDEIAERLLANEVIERDEIREIMDRRRAARPGRAPRSPRPTPARRRHPGRGAGLASRPAGRPSNLRARMFELIDHVGVAVADLDAAIDALRGHLRDAARPPRDGRRAGRRGGAARRRRLPRRAAAPARARTRRSASSSSARARGPAPRRLPGRRHRRRARAAARRRASS